MNNLRTQRLFTIVCVIFMWLSFLISITGCGGSKKQDDVQKTPAKREFMTLKIGNSTSSNDVRAILPGKTQPDNKNGVFIGTMEGLYFYDNDLKSVKQLTDGEGRLKSAKIISLCQEEGGKLWIGTEDGVYSYNFNSVRKFDVGKTQAVIQSGTNDLWVGTNFGLNLYDGSKGFTKYTRKSSNLANDDINCFAKDLKNNVVYAGSKQGVIIISGAGTFDAKTGTSMRPTPGGDLIEEAGNTEMSGNTISGIAINSKGVMYIGTNLGLNRCKNFSNWSVFSADSEVPAKTASGIGYKKVKGNSELLSNWIRSIYIDGDDELWIGTTKGLSYFNGDNKWENYTSSNGLCGNNVNSVCGIGKAVFIGTSSGVSIFDFPPVKNDKAK